MKEHVKTKMWINLHTKKRSEYLMKYTFGNQWTWKRVEKTVTSLINLSYGVKE